MWRVRDALFTGLICSWMPHITGERPSRPEGVRKCAAKGCDVEETGRWPFKLVCGGPCPERRKPRYCSRVCSWTVRRFLVVLFLR